MPFLLVQWGQALQVAWEVGLAPQGSLLFLLDERASGFITGVVLPVDGGFSAYSGV